MAIIISSLKGIIDKLNSDLGDFCADFARERKQLAAKKKSPSKSIFFKYDKDGRDWAINEGGGTEIQYHIYMRDGELGYGLGFNAQYVPFATNKKSPVEYIKPYADAFLELLEIHRSEWNSMGLDWIIGDGEEMLKNPTLRSYTLFGKKTEIVKGTMDEEFYNQMITDIKGSLFDIYKDVFKRRNELINLNKVKMQANELTNELVNILRHKKNLILYGAPGTGKTYLAKQIACKIIDAESDDSLEKSEQFAFVQFHPSYDYTDFVEGLRPTLSDELGNIGFELKNGIFKDFCDKARKNQEDSQKDNETLSVDLQIENKYNQLIESIENGDINKLKLKTSGKFAAIMGITEQNNIQFQRPSDGRKSGNTVSLSRLQQLGKKFKTKAQLEGLDNLAQSIRSVIGGCNATWYWSVLHYLYERYGDVTDMRPDKKIEKKDYVFVIDEINRGEISKIFGELFFSIDPGYRGEKGSVYTQYANMHETDEKFYVPNNVYIIGTMNDIDRSVETFDFAMRRRFVWREITAEESGENMNLTEGCKQRMKNLNDKITKIEGLGASYHIGGAYFLDDNGKRIENFDEIWNLRLKPLLYEYLRGIPNAEDNMNELKKAYYGAATDN